MAASWLSRTRYVCDTCASHYEIETNRFQCDCGDVLNLDFEVGTLPRHLEGRGGSIDRYHEAAPWRGSPAPIVDLGVRRTPLIELTRGVHAKCDFLLPTGSFKDRGAQVLIGVAQELGAVRVVVDSSGNAGAAVAAHCAGIGLSCTVVVPDTAPLAKLKQSGLYGATVLEVDGGREAVTAAATDLALEAGTFYASHETNPFFLEGTKAWAFEVWEQLGDAPDQVVMSVGNGSMLLGAHAGFTYLFEQGLVSRIPSIIAVQAAGWSSLTHRGPVDEPAKLADGIMIKSPRRLDQMHRALAASNGKVVVVDDQAIASAHEDLLHRGIWVEPTAAAAWAGIRELGIRDDGRMVLNLSGAGFKASV